MRESGLSSWHWPTLAKTRSRPRPWLNNVPSVLSVKFDVAAYGNVNNNRHSRYSFHRFCPFIKDEPRSNRVEVHTVEKTPQWVEIEKGKYCEYH